jgi:hypothetical protein
MIDTTHQATVRSGWPAKALAFTFLGLLCVAAYWVGSVLKQPGSGNGGLAVDGPYLNIGEVWEEKKFPWDLPVRNKTDHTIEIVRFRTSCNCVEITPQSLVLPAGDSANLHLTLDLTNTSQNDIDLHGQGFRVQVVPQLKGGLAAEAGWSLRGTVRRQFVVSPPFLDFQDSLHRGHPFQSRSLKVTCASNVTQLKAACEPSLATIDVKRIGANPDKFDISVFPRDTLPGGPFSFAVKINAVSPDGQAVPGTIDVRGTLLEDVYPLPNSIALGARPLGHTCEETVILHSRSGNQFTVTGFESDPGDLHVAPLNNAPNAPPGFKVSQRISKLGAQESRVRLFVRTDDSSQSQEISFPVAYHGIPK